MVPGERVGPLHIERLLAEGGMGEVYLARDTRLERPVALKLLTISNARERMLREARAASALHHPGIVAIYDIGEHDGQTYIAMEYVEGETLEAMVGRRGLLPPAEAVALVAQVGDALATAHEAGIVHRDIKSANLMIDRQGRAKVLDFGLCKRTGASEPPEPSSEAVSSGAPSNSPPQTEVGASLGTPGWAPPELMEGRPADIRSDVYSLGIVLYHLLTGQIPFPGYNWTMVRVQVARGPLPPSRIARSIPPALDAVVLSALAADPARRPASVRELVARIQAAVLEPPRRRVPRAVLAGIPIAAGAIGVALLVWRGRGPAAPGASASASAPERLTALGGCAYGPAFIDADTVTFDLTKDGGVDLYRLDLGGGAPIRLTSDPGWEWRSARGRREGEVAFIRSPEATSGAGAIEAIDLAAGARAVIMDRPSAAFAFVGDALYYASEGQLRRRAGGRAEVVHVRPAEETIDSIVATADGSRLALMSSDRSGAKLCLVETRTARASCPAAPVAVGQPAFSSDLSHLYFARHDGIGRLRVAGEVHEPVLSGILAGGGMAVSPDGRALVWSDCGGSSELIDASTEPPRTLATGGQLGSPAFGPGGRLAYTRKLGGTSQLIVRDPDGTDREIVSRAGATIGDVAFSPDGERVAFVVASQVDHGIYVASVQGVAPANRLTEDAGDARPSFLGAELVFTRRDRDRVPRPMRIDLDGSGARAIGHRPRLTLGADAEGRRALLASPDLEWLYWWDPIAGRESPGPSVKPAPLPSFSDAWVSPDGRWLLYLGGNDGRASWRLRLDGESQLELVRSRDDVTATGGAIDPSGRTLLVSYRWIGELWIARAADGARW